MPWMSFRFNLGVILLLLILARLSNEIRYSHWVSSHLLEKSFDAAVKHDHGSNFQGKITIYPGELPGYTGWARPAMTLAGSFRMAHPCSSTSLVNTNWICSVHCSHKACQNGGSLFFVRAYGPAILPGLVTDHRNGTYDVIFHPMDEGIYTVEVVLTYSTPPPFSNFPMRNFTEPGYEGYMLPSFPLTVSITQQSPTPYFKPQGSLPLCTMSDLLESSSTSALETGRWVVAEKMIDRPFSQDSHFRDHNGNITLDGYQQGENSLGIRMDYRLTNCTLLDERAITSARILNECMERSELDFSSRRQLHILFVGDSNTERQWNWARDIAGIFGGKVKYTYVDLKDGLNWMLPRASQDLANLYDSDHKSGISDHYILIINSGLHDISLLCGAEYFGLHIDFSARGVGRCIDAYRTMLREFARVMKSFPSALTIFQTTTASWPKWGAFGNAWPPDEKQPLPFSSSFAEHFNTIAWEVMTEFDIPIMDAYWLTFSRPDHRETNAKNDISQKMVHAGPEVYSVLVRKWAMLALETICGPKQ
jgi:hypothetical protein